MITPLPLGEGKGGGAIIFLAFVCSVHLCVLWEKEKTWDSVGSFISHRTHRSNRPFLRTVSSPQKASGVQNSQNLSAIIITNKGHKEAYILLIGVSRWLRPSLWGRGRGRGLYLCGPLCVLFICVLCEKKNIFETRWGVLSLTEHTAFTERYNTRFQLIRRWSAP